MIRRFVSGAVTTSALLLTLLGAPAAAQNQNDQGQNNNDQGRTHVAPEFDVTAAGAVAAVIVGGGVLLGRRRRR